MRKTLILGLAATLLSGLAHAELIVGDWKVAGDEKLLLDTRTGIEWLRLSETTNVSINDFEAQNGAGQQYEGFEVAVASEVERVVASMHGVYDLADVFDTVTDRTGQYGPYNEYVINKRGYASGTESMAKAKLFSTTWWPAHPSTASYGEGYISMTADYYSGNPFPDEPGGVDTDVLRLTSYTTEGNRRASDDEAVYAINHINGNRVNNSAWGGLMVKSTSLQSYSSTNDAEYASAREAGLSNVSAPMALSVLGLFGLMTLRRKRK